MSQPIIFLSHSHSDHRLAESFHNLLDDITGHRLSIKRSSDEGEIKTGANWRDWITDSIRDCRIAIILLTPASLRGRWVMWEAGAVAGVQFERSEAEGQSSSAEPSSQSANGRRVRVLTFGLRNVDLGPFGDEQTKNGLNGDHVSSLIQEILDDFQDDIGSEMYRKGLIRLTATCAEFAAKAREDMKFSGISADEPLIQSWLDRLQAHADQPEWVAASTRWINVAFHGAGNADGKDANNQPLPVDFRIHTMIARSHRRLGNFRAMAEQLELARRLSPNDLVILRDLGQAYRKMEFWENLNELFVQMEELDPSIFVKDRESIALKVGFYTDNGSFSEAVSILKDADANLVANDYYLLNWYAYALMMLGNAGDAKERYGQILTALEGKDGFWETATRINALIALEKNDQATKELRAIKRMDGWRDQQSSASAHYDMIAAKLNKPMANWREQTNND